MTDRSDVLARVWHRLTTPRWVDEVHELVEEIEVTDREVRARTAELIARHDEVMEKARAALARLDEEGEDGRG